MNAKQYCGLLLVCAVMSVFGSMAVGYVWQSTTPEPVPGEVSSAMQPPAPGEVSLMVRTEHIELWSQDGTVFGGLGVNPRGTGSHFTLFEETKQNFIAADVQPGHAALILHGKDSEIAFKVDNRGRAFIELTNKAGEKLRLEPSPDTGN